jgi:hypothetical protein
MSETDKEAERKARQREYTRRWRLANAEKVREYNQRWRLANIEKAREYNRRWYLANIEKVREYRRRWRLANVEKRRESGRRWYWANRDKIREAARRRHYHWRLRNPDKAREQRRRQWLREQYGLTVEEYDRLLAAQGGGCALCGSAERLAIDHDHDTGAVRGLLCHACNTGIGLLRDDPERALRAAAYLLLAPAFEPVARTMVV